MSTRFSSWQGSLRGAPGTQKENVQSKPGAKEKRSALGDISNRSQVSGFGGAKKQGPAKPSFQIQAEVAPAPRCDALAIHFTPVTEIDRVDANDILNPKYAAEYVGEIYDNYKSIELKYHPSSNYMDIQTDINEKMRAVLIDWLVQVHAKFELLPQTLYLTVNLLDRFLERKVVPRRKFQLVGCACMLLASKYEEIYAPVCQDFVSMSDNAFSIEDLLKMEGVLLNVLGFCLTCPSPYTFLRRFMKVACSHAETQHFATYLIERSLQEYELLTMSPSLLASASLYIAQSLTDDSKNWGSTVVRHSGYSEEDLMEPVSMIKEMYSSSNQQSNSLNAVFKKYSSSKFMSVATIPLEGPYQ